MRTPTLRSAATAILLGLMAVMLPWSYALGSTSDAAKVAPPVSPPGEANRKDAQDVRVSPDNSAGSYRRLDGTTDATHDACSTNRRQQHEPSVAVNPHNTKVIAAAAMDVCIAQRSPLPLPQAQSWASYYRSADGGNTWSASLMPGYPGDAAQPFETDCVIQADPTLSFDNEGRLYYGGLCLVYGGDVIPADFQIAVATFEDDGTRLVRQVRVDVPKDGRLSDKPMLAVDQTDGRFAGNLYVAFTECGRPIPCLPGKWEIKIARSTDQARSFSDPITLSPPGDGMYSFADLAVGPDGAVYVTYRSFLAPFDVYVTKSTDGGETFTDPVVVETIAPFDSAQYISEAGRDQQDLQRNFDGGAPEGSCGDGPFACPSGFNFPVWRTFPTIAADDAGVHLAWSAELPNGQGKVFVRNSPDGLTWTEPSFPIDSVPTGHQFYPDMASADGTLSVMFYDSRTDAAYSPDRPPGNTATGTNSGLSLDAYVASSTDGGVTWQERRLTTVSSQPNYETYLDGRSPSMGDYIMLSAVRGGTFAVWTDLRDVVSGDDTRSDSAENGFDVFAPCTWLPNTVGGPTTGYAAPRESDACLSQGGLDSNIYGSPLPEHDAKDDKDKAKDSKDSEHSAGTPNEEAFSGV